MLHQALGDRLLGAALADGDVVNEGLRVVDRVGDDAGEPSRVLGPAGVEALLDELGVALVGGEDDGLAEPIPVGHLEAVGHELLEDLVDGVLVAEEPPEVAARHRLRWSLLAPFREIPRLAFVLAELVVVDARVLELRRDRHLFEGHEVAVGDGLVEGVGVGGDTVLEVEQPVGVVVDLVLGRGGEPHEEAVEVLEQLPVLRVDKAVGLVDHHEVELPGAELPLPRRPHHLELPEHRRVGGDHDAGAGDVAALEQVDRARRRCGSSRYRWP